MTELVKQLAEQWEGHGAWAILTTIVSVIIATLISKKLDAWWLSAVLVKVNMPSPIIQHYFPPKDHLGVDPKNA